MKVTKVTDGDTIRVEAPWVLPELGDSIAIRILGIDTPEKGGRAKCEAEAALGAEATEFAKSVIAVGDVVQVDVLQWDKFGGRINADVYVDGENFAQMQIERGLAVPYDGGTKDSWCD
jgi:endonuclease YncB( thermonuclease family)